MSRDLFSYEVVPTYILLMLVNIKEHGGYINNISDKDGKGSCLIYTVKINWKSDRNDEFNVIENILHINVNTIIILIIIL